MRYQIIALGVLGCIVASQASRAPLWLFSLVWIAALVAGAFMIRHGLYYIRLGKESNSWPIVKGRVVRSFLHSHTSSSTDQNGFTSTSTSYSPRIQYLYQLHGIQYRSAAMVIGGGSLSFSSQERAEFYID